MSSAHWHLVLTHVPILGVPAGLALLAWGYWKKSPDLRSAALVAFILCGLLAFFAKQTGDGAEDQIEQMAGFSKSLVHQHEEMADKAFLLTAGLALASLGVLLAGQRRTLPRATYPALLVLGLASAGLLAYTGALGGEIRHTEIRGEFFAPAQPAANLATEIEDRD